MLEDHWQDVTVGSILGLIVAYFSYRQYYPSLADERSHRPYSPRIKDENSEHVLPVHNLSHGQIYDQPGDSIELDGTVRRPGPQHLQAAWKDHDDSGGGEPSELDRSRLVGGDDTGR